MNLPPIPDRKPDSQPCPRFVKALQEALPLMWDGVNSGGSHVYICNAVNDSLLEREIESRLSGGLTYRMWVDYGGVDFNDEEIQAGRKAWMLDLIEEFS